MAGDYIRQVGWGGAPASHAVSSIMDWVLVLCPPTPRLQRAVLTACHAASLPVWQGPGSHGAKGLCQEKALATGMQARACWFKGQALGAWRVKRGSPCFYGCADGLRRRVLCHPSS